MAKVEIIDNRKIADNYYKVILKPSEDKEFRAGQFVNLSVGKDEGMLLKRPISVSRFTSDTIELLYEVRGKGTQRLSQMREGSLDADYYLGNGFDIKETDKKIMVVAGGMGAAPLYSVLNQYADREFYSYIGYQSKDKIILYEEYKHLSKSLTITTDDGSFGRCGFITQCVLEDIEEIKPDVVVSCGPKPMLKELTKIKSVRVLVSVEERMGCGIGACLVCVCKTKSGHKRVCKDGPVFDIKELIL